MSRLRPRTNRLLTAILAPAVAPVPVGTRIPDQLPAEFVMARRVGGSAVDPRFLDDALVDVQTWARSDARAEDLAQTCADALFRASRSPQTVVPGVGYVSWFVEESAPVDLPAGESDHGTYRYQATYRLMVRPA